MRRPPRSANRKLYLVRWICLPTREETPIPEEGRYTKTLKVRIDPELYDRIKEEADRLDTDVSSYVRWCINTGLYLKDLNLYIHSKSKDED